MNRSDGTLILSESACDDGGGDDGDVRGSVPGLEDASPSREGLREAEEEAEAPAAGDASEVVEAVLEALAVEVQNEAAEEDTDCLEHKKAGARLAEVAAVEEDGKTASLPSLPVDAGRMYQIVEEQEHTQDEPVQRECWEEQREEEQQEEKEQQQEMKQEEQDGQ